MWDAFGGLLDGRSHWPLQSVDSFVGFLKNKNKVLFVTKIFKRCLFTLKSKGCKLNMCLLVDDQFWSYVYSYWLKEIFCYYILLTVDETLGGIFKLRLILINLDPMVIFDKTQLSTTKHLLRFWLLMRNVLQTWERNIHSYFAFWTRNVTNKRNMACKCTRWQWITRHNQR